jgi:biotin transport system substrate-specific component
MQTHAKVGAIADALIPRSSPSVNIVVDAGLIVGFAALTAVLAKVAVYLNPAVPITGQTFGVLMAGAVLGSKRGAASMLVYLGYGIAGIPVFAPEAAMSGLSRGYLLGFVAAAFIVGLLVERGWGRNPFKLAAAMFAGEVAIYAFGLPWLAYYIPADQLVERSRLAVMYEWGLRDFIIGDSIKLAMAAAGVPLAWEGIRRLKGEGGPRPQGSRAV